MDQEPNMEEATPRRQRCGVFILLPVTLLIASLAGVALAPSDTGGVVGSLRDVLGLTTQTQEANTVREDRGFVASLRDLLGLNNRNNTADTVSANGDAGASAGTTAQQTGSTLR